MVKSEIAGLTIQSHAGTLSRERGRRASDDRPLRRLVGIRAGMGNGAVDYHNDEIIGA